jgi:phospholipid/cholesterol/gamma-HCH transport system permease protein
VTQSLNGCGWRATIEGANTLLTLTSDWTMQDTAVESDVAEKLLDRSDLRSMAFDSRELGRWDSSLLVFLSALRQASLQRGIHLNETGLPAAARRLMALLPDKPAAVVAPARRGGMLGRVGSSVIAQYSELVAITALVGDEILRTGAALCGRARMRGIDLITCMYDAGIAALPMVALVNILVGGILAFVGAVQLRRFGAGIYIANLVGVAEVREMAAVMTAIVMSGRTGGAYAAEIAAMQGSEELDALRVFGIPVHDYLILPRVCALTLMMPLLYLYGSAMGILGGFVVAVAMLNISPESFIAQTRSAVTESEIVFGLIKSLLFGALIAFAGCRIGMKAGRSATDVGYAATTAVVVGIIGVIVVDAICAVCANALDI